MRLNTEAEEAQRHLGDQSMSKDPKVEPECLDATVGESVKILQSNAVVT